jgi:hypothetical protein
VAHDAAHKTLGVAEEHEGFVFVVERVIDAGEAGVQAALDDHDGAGLVGPSRTHFVLSI